MSGASIGTTLRTLRHLRLSQCWWRSRRLLERRRWAPERAARWQWHGADGPALRRPFPAVPFSRPMPEAALADLRLGVFRHLNEVQLLGKDQTDWRLGPISRGRLWTITLHYHAWAFALATQAAGSGVEAADAAHYFRHYVSDWIERCALDRPGARELAWNPYAIATRIGWWIRSYHALGPDRWCEWPEFHARFLASLWSQAAYLADHLEWDLRANHLLRDAAGLAWAGRFFAGPQADRWLATAERIGAEQAREQVLADGGHFERSPHYHAHAMEDFDALAQLTLDNQRRTEWCTIRPRMADFLHWVTHPDGGLAQLNDGSRQGAPGIMANHRDGGSVSGRYFKQTGLVAWRGNPWALFFDVGPIGPDEQPGHGHADTLTIEASFRGHRLFVDPGAHSYDADERRRYDRSTAAHNTVSIDGEDSSEVWHIFRVGRRARPVLSEVMLLGGLDACASHDGYDHLPGRPRHERRVSVYGDGMLTLVDHVRGARSHRLEGGLLVGPDWSVSSAPQGWQLSRGADRVRVTVAGPAQLHRFQETRPYHPEYGREEMTTRLCWAYSGDLPVEMVTRVEPG